MKIAIVGYGKMGKVIEKIALSRGHEIVERITTAHPIENANWHHVDVAIEFSTPQTVLHHLDVMIKNYIPVVVGTTGWNEQLHVIQEKIKTNNGALVHASNFSIGVNLFFELNTFLAQLMNEHKAYAVRMEEIHHTQKLDAPSGTAITLAEGIIANHDAVATWNCPQHETKNEFNGGVEINAVRLPDVPGTHSVTYSSPIDDISITHQAHNREGFALGAVIAAEFLLHKKGVFTMRDVLNLSFTNQAKNAVKH